MSTGNGFDDRSAEHFADFITVSTILRVKVDCYNTLLIPLRSVGLELSRISLRVKADCYNTLLIPLRSVGLELSRRSMTPISFGAKELNAKEIQ